MSHETHIVKINALSIGSAIGNATQKMKAKDKGDNSPYALGAFCPSTGAESGRTLQMENGARLTEEAIYQYARSARFMKLFWDLPIEAARWRSPTEMIEGEEPEYLEWLAKKEQNEREMFKFASSVTSSKEEKVYSLPMLHAWIKAISEGNDYLSKDHALSTMVERITETMPDFPFCLDGSLYSNRCWNFMDWNWKIREDQGKIYYVFFDVHT